MRRKQRNGYIASFQTSNAVEWSELCLASLFWSRRNDRRPGIFPKCFRLYNEEKNLSSLLIKSTLYLSVEALIPAILIILFALWAFSFILGAECREAGVYSSW